jgi:thiol-disulfide isomerase/thioredoxin
MVAEPGTESHGLPSGNQTASGRVWLYIALAFLAFWVVYLSFFGPKAERSTLENSAMSQPAEYDWSASDLEGRRTSFEGFRGKTVFLNIWATWCPPCVQEMPSIAKLAANPKLQGKNIAFVCVSVDDSDDTVLRFIADKNWGMTFLRATSMPSVFQTDGIPTTFVIDTRGRIAAFKVGSRDWSEPEVVEFLAKLAK